MLRGLWRHWPVGSLKWCQKRRKRKEREKGERKGKNKKGKGEKRKKINQHDRRGAIQGLQLQACQIDGGG